MKFGRAVNSDEQKLWEAIVSGDVQAFETIVERHQATVSAIAYSIVGDFAISQDIAQEAFFVAWKSRDKLKDPTRAAAWLCGISRNLARNWQRKQYRGGKKNESILQYEPASDVDDPSRSIVQDEEATVVWSTLSKMPENYREVMMLYYRQGESISNVAETLELSEEAVRQRLSRGRSMLRNRVAEMLEGVLERTTPGKTFTTKVMAGLIGLGVASKASSAAMAANAVATGFVAGKTISTAASASTATGVGSKAVAATVASGFTGALIGILGGVGGAAAGAFLPSEFAPTETERQFLRKRGVSMMLRALAFVVVLYLLIAARTFMGLSQYNYVAILLGIILIFVVIESLYVRQTNALVLQLRENITPATDPNLSKFKSTVKATKPYSWFTSWKGRRYQSRTRLLGLPLIDIQVSDPTFKTGSQRNLRAKGWIAIGDHAYGLLIANGSLAVGSFAFGGRAIGLVAIGGLSFGLFGVGGLACAVFAFGGLAAGWDSAGGLAVGWDSATGDVAYANHVAVGRHAVANEYAVGRFGGRAAEFNTESAHAVAASDSFQWALDYYMANQVLTNTIFFTVVILLTVVFLSLSLKREKPAA